MGYTIPSDHHGSVPSSAQKSELQQPQKIEPIITHDQDKLFVAHIDAMALNIMLRNEAKGFWPNGVNRNKIEMHMLMVTEVAEMTEAVRRVEPKPSPKIPYFTEEEEELADLVIRAMDYAGGFSLRLGQAIIAKLRYNAARPHKHGKTC